MNTPFQRQRRDWLASLAGATLLGSCAVADAPAEARAPEPVAPVTPATPEPPDQPPPTPREFRAAWVATVANIDWPSKPGLSADTLRSEAIAILDRAQLIGLNALILQVRPAGDAIYPSPLEPWTEYLSGEQGRGPWLAGEAPWDPLAFWVREAHRRALELHVWFNPYRARHSSAKSPQVAQHIGSGLPGVVKRYGDQLWMDPGEPAAAAHSLAVVADVVRRYDVDAVHIDDYFYPYPVKAGDADTPFPDSESFARYQLGGGALERDDWRRSNVDRFVQDLYATVHQAKPWVRVGISPFGVGKPERRPAGVAGFSQYDKLYADVEKWLASGWLDYLAPQLYWPVLREGLPFEPLLDQWVAENTPQRHLWPGLFTSQLGKPGWKGTEILQQIQLQRARGDKATGHIHFSMVALMQDREGIATALRAGLYAHSALVPATPWLQEPPQPVQPPTLRREGARVRIVPGAGGPAQRWAVWRRSGTQWRFAVQAAQDTTLDPAGADLLTAAAVDRVGLLGPAGWLRLAPSAAAARPPAATPAPARPARTA